MYVLLYLGAKIHKNGEMAYHLVIIFYEKMSFFMNDTFRIRKSVRLCPLLPGDS